MTLAVAVVCPFPFNDDRSVPKTGIVFAADTRYSYPEKDKPPFDRGIKIIQLGSAAGCAFSGDVLSAVTVAKYLNAVFARPVPSYSPNMLDDEIEYGLRLAEAENLHEGRNPHYAMLLAFVTGDRVPVLSVLGPRRPLKFSSRDWGAIIGDRLPGDEEAFEVVLRQEIMRPGMLQGTVLDPTWWMLPVGLAFSDFTNSRPRSSVGGALQVAAVSAYQGFRQNEIWLGRRDENHGIAWELRTPPVSFD